MSANTYTPYFPFGFRYPDGLIHSDANPDPLIQRIEKRMEYLNRLHQASGMPGHIFAAALKLFQSETARDVDEFWDSISTTLSDDDVIALARNFAPMVADERERLDFPNAIALFDCRFVSTKEWESVRRYSIGGSEATAVLGLSHFQSPLTLYLSKTADSGEQRDIGSQQILDYGHDLENYIIEEICTRLGAVHWPEYRMFAHKDFPYITCNPDGILYFPSDGHYALFEAKTAMWLKKKDWTQGIPEYYAPQPKQYMEVLNDPKISSGYIAVCTGGLPSDLLCHAYQRDKEAGQAQIQQIQDYWNNHIVTRNPPDFCGTASLDHQALYSYGKVSMTTGTKPLSANAVALFERYTELKAEKSALGKSIQAMKAQESELLAQITEPLPDGLTISEKEGEIAYEISVEDSVRRSVNLSDLYLKAPDAAQWIQSVANKLAGMAESFSIPSINAKAAPKKKATSVTP